jgi:hypothetical protein
MDPRERPDYGVQGLLFLSELLGALLVRPDRGLAQLRFDFGEAFLLGVEVKDTSAAPPTATAGRRGGRRSG